MRLFRVYVDKWDWDEHDAIVLYARDALDALAQVEIMAAGQTVQMNGNRKVEPVPRKRGLVLASFNAG